MKFDITLAVPGLPFNGNTFDNQSLGGCVTADTLIDIPRDVKAHPNGVPIKEICQRISAGEQLHVYSFDQKLGRIGLRRILKAWRTKKNAEVWELSYTWITPSGETQSAVLKATPDHKIMLRDGSYKALSKLKPNDSLMPFNRFQGKRKSAKYFRIDLNDGAWVYEHHFIPNELGWKYQPKRGMIGDVVHHKNFRWYDNSISNLRVMDWKDHLKLHQGSSQGFREWYDNLSEEGYLEFCRKQRALVACVSPQGRKRSIRAGIRGLKQWNKQATQAQLDAKHKKIADSNRIVFNSDPKLRQMLVENGRKAGGRNKGIPHTLEDVIKMRVAAARPESREAKADGKRRFWAALTKEERRAVLLPALAARHGGRFAAELARTNHTVVAIRKLTVREDVYDLEVEETHNFVANGIVIHNSETAGYYMGRALARLGHRVQVFCNTPQRVTCADVDYLPLGMFRQVIEYTPHDVCIVQRAPELFSAHCQARFSALWCHDLAMRGGEAATRGTAWNYDKLFVLSDFMHKQYKEVYQLPEELFHVTRNGIDLKTIEHTRQEASKLKGAARNPLSLVYSARPERGLDILLAEIMPRILKYEPNARLFLSYYDNKVPQLAEFYAQCDALIAALGNSVVRLGALTKSQLYSVYQSAGVYVYPLPSAYAPVFDEISCISIMEAQGNGLPVVTTARGALPETLAPGAGILISEPIHTPAYFDAFAEATLSLMRDPAKWEAASRAGLARAANLDWDGVAREWTDLFEAEIRKNNRDLGTLANHFWRRSDIYAAKEVLRRLPVDDAKSKPVRNRVEKDWAFLTEPEGFRKQYERIGGTHDESVLHWAAQEPRYAAIRGWLHQMSTTGQVKSVLDYGCAHGAYAVNLLKEIPALSITGVDIDLNGIRMGYQFAEKLGVADRWRGVVGDTDRLTDSDVPEMREQYDVVVAQEVLEHVPDAVATLRALEARVKDGGFVYITVPFGPWEYSDYRRYPHRAHLFEFDLHDLHDILDAKGASAEVSMSAMPFGHSQETDESLGWWVIYYKVTAQNRGIHGVIDMERKLWLQRPRQTVSAAIIAGPDSEETLHWCLRSLEHVADEVVIADCGLSSEALRVLESYQWRDAQPGEPIPARPNRCMLNLRVIPGADPKQTGFETPRNMVLKECTQDWVLWIDTDEKLIQPEKLCKYLRANMFQGYSIRQHHFTVDTHFDPDMPVRLFRNNDKLQFYGMIHEHPEEKLNEGPGLTVVIGDVHIPHVGYLIESGRKQRFARNFPMLQADIKKYPERRLQKHFIMRDEIMLCMYELQMNGGKVTPMIQARAQNVIDIYRRYFSGQGHYTNVDPISYYSQAVQLLGQGFDVSLAMSADKFEAKPNGVLKVRFANKDDFMAELNRRASDMVQPFESRYS